MKSMSFVLVVVILVPVPGERRVVAEENPVPQVASATILTAAQARADIFLVRQAYEAIHPGYTRYTTRTELDRAWDRLLSRAERPMSDAGLYLELSKLLTRIACDHTKAELPRKLTEARKATPSFHPFRLILEGTKAFVFSSATTSPFHRGDRILSIDGRSMEAIVARIFEMIPVDGKTDFVKGAAFESSGDYLGSAFEHFYPLLYGDWQRATVILSRKGKTMALEARPIDWQQWQELAWPGQGFRPDFKDSVALRTLEDGVAILTIDTFVNYRKPVDPEVIYRPIFEELEEKNIRSLIIDTRRNGGGSDDAATGLLAYLLPEPTALFRWKQVRTIDLTAFADHLKTWDPRALKPDPEKFTELNNGWFAIKPEADPITLRDTVPREPRFRGKIIALTSAANASGITLLLASLQDRAGATLVGSRTGGNAEGPTAGMIFFLELPNSGIRARIPWQLQRSNVRHPARGLGVVPDRLVVPTASDRLSGKDPVLAAALELARAHLAGQAPR